MVEVKRAQAEGSNRVVRGGSWNNNARNCRCAYRNNAPPDNRNSNIGFRVVFVPQLIGRSDGCR
jgi:formylglycine-generating enzyme required for sulfatase activity